DGCDGDAEQLDVDHAERIESGASDHFCISGSIACGFRNIDKPEIHFGGIAGSVNDACVRGLHGPGDEFPSWICVQRRRPECSDDKRKRDDTWRKHADEHGDKHSDGSSNGDIHKHADEHGDKHADGNEYSYEHCDKYIDKYSDEDEYFNADKH